MKVTSCNECPAKFEVIPITDDEILHCPSCGSPLEESESEDDSEDFEDDE
jgi:uncharacterized paraquat-inducible protein A